MTTAQNFQHKLMNAKNSYDRNKDGVAYFSSALKTALQLMADEHGHNRVSNILSGSSPVFEAAIDYGMEGFVCPVNNGHSVYDFLQGLNSHIQQRLKKDFYNPVEKHLPQKVSAALGGLIDIL